MLNPFYYALRLAAGFLMARRGEGDTAHFPGIGGKLRSRARWWRGDLDALRLTPRMLRKRAEIRRALSPGEVRRLCFLTG